MHLEQSTRFNRHGPGAIIAAGLALSIAPATLAQDFNGDGFADLAVGAPGEPIAGAAGTGAVTVIYGNPPAVGLDAFAPIPSIQLTQATFGYDVNEPGDAFGWAIAWGDFNMDGFDDLAVSAFGEDSPAGVPDCGVVYVFHGTPVGFMPAPAPIIAQGFFGYPDITEAGDGFGFALASGDFNADGFDDLAIGVAYEDAAAADQGMVHQAWGSPGGLMPFGGAFPVFVQSMLGDPDEVGDGFGMSLAAGQLDGVPGDDLAIGAPMENFPAADTDSGMVHVVYAAPGAGLDPFAPTPFEVWTQDTPCVSEATDPGDTFGFALAIGDFDADPAGAEDLAIGAPGEDNGANFDNGGVTVIYSVAAPGLGLEACGPLASQFWRQGVGGVPGGFESFDAFGRALATCNFDGTLGDDLAVGVPYEDVGANADCGAVNVIYSAGPGVGLSGLAAPVLAEFWHQNVAGVGGSNAPMNYAGWSLTAGDFDGTGCCDLAVGVPGDDFGAILDAGSVFTLYGNPPPLGLDAFGPVPSEFWHQGVPGIPDVHEALDGWGMGLDNDD